MFVNENSTRKHTRCLPATACPLVAKYVSCFTFPTFIDPNVPLGLVKYVENVFQVLYSVSVFRDYINKLRPPV